MGGAPLEKAADKSTFDGIKPRFTKLMIPPRISFSLISGGGAVF